MHKSLRDAHIQNKEKRSKKSRPVERDDGGTIENS